MNPSERGHTRVAVAQMCSVEDVSANLAWVSSAASEASQGGASLLALPENATLLAPPELRLKLAEPLTGPTVTTLCGIARRQKLALLVGSFPEQGGPDGRSYATALWIDAGGRLVATYRKAHLFDVDVAPDTRFCESDTIAPGDGEPVVVAHGAWSVGLSICYDLRFPEHFRALSERGSDVLAVPSAFTMRTGMAHWEPLLRARAIENQCYVIAPAQWGQHYGARESFGDAMVVSPWGEVLARHGRGTGVVTAELNGEVLAAVRGQIPCLTHRRRWVLSDAPGGPEGAI